MRRRLLLILPVLALTLGLLGFTVAQAADCPTTDPSCGCGAPCGCTPGYWKNHTDSWPAGFTTDTEIGDICGLGSVDLNDKAGEDTLLEALNYKGGSGIDGARRILLRAAVAAALNAAATDCYPLECCCIQERVHAVWDGSRDEILALATELDGYNNAGCPFN